MSGFPALDPIPLPAPVWLFKLLHVVTIALHFIAMQMAIGGMIAAVALSLTGKSAEAGSAARGLARRLPVVMTYVINLGVPPLLFAQVLYGPALYTSSVLIGAWWIAVIPLLMACYWLLYRFSSRLEAGRPAWWIGLAAFALAGLIAQIYAGNMTLMLRPEAWQAMYSASPGGSHLPSGDPTLPARLSFMLCGGLTVGGLWMVWISGLGEYSFTERRFLSNWGGRIAAVSIAIQAALAYRVVFVQPPFVQDALRRSALHEGALYAWLTGAALVLALALWCAFSVSASRAASWSAPALALVLSGSMAIYRDGIRDLTLLGKGFDVWSRTVATNWSIVILFLVLFVGALGVVGWLVSVVARAKTAAAKAA